MTSMLSGDTGDNRRAELQRAAIALGYESVDAYLLALHEANRAGVLKPRKPPADVLKGDDVVVMDRNVAGVRGQMILGDSRSVMAHTLEPESVDLIFTSPPFALLKKKAYGNEDSNEYLEWFRSFASGMHRVLSDRGSLVIDIGGAWKKGLPVRSLYHFELASMLSREYGFHLCQEFYWWNPARLPGPAEWTNIRRIRVKDAVNVVWWFSKTPFPRANNQRILQEYSDSMKGLLSRGSYNAGNRPSGHKISKRGFLSNRGGSIPPNLIAASNTESNGAYRRYCAENGIRAHPATFPVQLPAMFIRFLTDVGDVVYDPFAGSCTTGEAAERLGRNWICSENQGEYLDGARGRFLDSEIMDIPSDVDRFDDSLGPYSLAAPNLSALPEQECPLPSDGGRCRQGDQVRLNPCGHW